MHIELDFSFFILLNVLRNYRTYWKVTFGTLSTFSRRSFANHFNIFRYNVVHFSQKKNIFPSQVAFSVVAFSGQAALVLFGVPLSNARAVKNKMKKRKKRRNFRKSANSIQELHTIHILLFFQVHSCIAMYQMHQQ